MVNVPVIDAVGAGLTTTVAVSVSVHPLPSVTVTVYIPAVLIADVVALLPNPFDHA